MKKLFASLLAATMVAGMAVSAFAYCDNAGQETTALKGADEVYTNDDYTFAVEKSASKIAQVYKKDSDKNSYIEPFAGTSVDGGKLYYPILVAESELKETGAGAGNYFYATKASEVEDLKAKVSAIVGKDYIEKEANIVRKKVEVAGDATTQKTIYCVEVKLADFKGTEEKEVEFDIALYNKGKKQVSTKDETAAFANNFTFGSDAWSIDVTTSGATTPADTNVADGTYHGIYKAKFKKNELSMTVLPDAEAFQLDEAVGADGTEDIELITLDFTKANATFEVSASDQGDLFLGYSTDANKDIVLANQDADIDFVDFDANPTFDFTGTLKLTVEDADKTYFCYEVKDGKVTPVGKYNAEDECFEIRTRTLGSYAISDKELVNAKEEKPAEEKPVVEKPADKVVGTGAIA